jgi:hypothetical protein
MCDAAGFLLLPLREEARVNGDEGSRERSFTEEVLQEVRDLQGGLEGVRRIRVAEVVGEYPLANETGDAAEEYPRPDEKRVTPRAPWAVPRPRRRS